MAIRVLVTGGTIDGLDYRQEPDAPKRRKSRVPSILRDARITHDYQVTILFLKDSRFITDRDLELIAKRCKSCREKRILLTHGSVTMAATAKYLAKKRIGKTIVLSGAITPAARHFSDSKFNMGFAYAAARFLPPGVYVAMNGRVFPASNVRKNQKTQYFEKER